MYSSIESNTIKNEKTTFAQARQGKYEYKGDDDDDDGCRKKRSILIKNNLCQLRIVFFRYPNQWERSHFDRGR